MKGNERLLRQEGGAAEGGGMSHKPIITCAGDWNLFCTVEAPLVAAIPQDTSEWRRSYGRVFKSVIIEAAFEKFSKDILPGENDWNILKQPIFHIYWTDCTDVESYKNTTRDDIEAWLKVLAQYNVTDWMIVLVETYDIRKTNKLLPRTTVLDKIRNEFASKNGDRCLSVINPIKSESRSAESWRGLVSRIRHLVLTAYNKSLIRFEEHMREQRERRNEPNWNFCNYFLLQEQLALVFEMLGLFDEALVQYDELDALFTQFVLNSCISESPSWLTTFQKPIEMWQGVCLNPNVSLKKRDLLRDGKATLIDFRTYLFQRQSTMLLSLSRPWEIASRCLSVIHNTVKELQVLELTMPVGAFACWALLTCLEVLHTCERLASNASHQVVEQCATHQAPLWHYAKDKLWDLGKLCGLLPGTPEPSSAQIHLVVMLSAGMGDIEVMNPGDKLTPIDILKESLGSKQAFQTHYLELAELAMGTYKHIGRLRCARLIGRDLAAFYNELGETGKACVFLMDALRSYEEQGWKDLAAQTRMELIACYLKMEDHEKYSKLSAAISCTMELEILVRNFYFDEMRKWIKNNLKDAIHPILAELGDCFKILTAEVLPSERGSHIKDNTVRVLLCVESFFPREVVCQRASISLELQDMKKPERKPQDKTNKTDLSNVNSNVSQVSPVKRNVSSAHTVPETITPEYISRLQFRALRLVKKYISKYVHFGLQAVCFHLPSTDVLTLKRIRVSGRNVSRRKMEAHGLQPEINLQELNNRRERTFNQQILTVLMNTFFSLKYKGSSHNISIFSIRLDDLKPPNPLLQPLNMTLKLDWKEDKTLDTASVQCNISKGKLKRSDSNKYRKPSATQRNDFTNCFSLENISIKPGVNQLILQNVSHQAGLFRLGQISLVIEDKLEYLSNALMACKLCYEVVTRGFNVVLNKLDPKKDLIAGVEHPMELVVTSGSAQIEKNCKIQLRTSRGLAVKQRNVPYQKFVSELDINIQQSPPFSTVSVPLTMFAILQPRKDDKPIEHKIFLQCPWWETPVIVTLHFAPPLLCVWKLFTSNDKKIIHVTLSPSTNDQISLVVSNPKLETEAKVTLADLNPKTKQKYVLGSNGITLSLMWELQMDPLEKAMPIKTMFTISYKVVDDEQQVLREYKCPYEMQDYTTLFIVKTKVEPTKGSEFCRASQMCYLQLSVQKVNETNQNSLMYEVLADQTMWAVCGRTAGVITLENCEPQTVTLDVMPLIAGYLPLPAVRLSKYIAAIQQQGANKGKADTMANTSHPRLEPFSSGQVYHSGKALQVHVLTSVSSNEQQH